MKKGDFEIVFSAHAVFRAEERGIAWELIESTIQTGKFKKFGKRMIKISKKFGENSITCVGEVKNECIKIITITYQTGD